MCCFGCPVWNDSVWSLYNTIHFQLPEKKNKKQKTKNKQTNKQKTNKKQQKKIVKINK